MRILVPNLLILSALSFGCKSPDKKITDNHTSDIQEALSENNEIAESIVIEPFDYNDSYLYYFEGEEIPDTAYISDDSLYYAVKYQRPNYLDTIPRQFYDPILSPQKYDIGMKGVFEVVDKRSNSHTHYELTKFDFQSFFDSESLKKFPISHIDYISTTNDTVKYRVMLCVPDSDNDVYFIVSLHDGKTYIDYDSEWNDRDDEDGWAIF